MNAIIAVLGKLARGVIVECSDGAEQDAAKASKRAAREEAKSRAAYEKHLAELAAAAEVAARRATPEACGPPAR
jgi:hypothetical protein